MENNIKENTIEKSLIVNKKTQLAKILKTATGILFYTSTFIVSVAIGYMFIFSVFN